MSFRKWLSILGLSLLLVLFLVGGNISCQKKAEEPVAPAEEEKTIKEGTNEFEGVAKIGHGKYLYVPAAKGFDVVVLGGVESGDASVLVDKEVKIRGEFSRQRASILLADSIDVKEGGQWRNVYTRTAEPVLDDYLDLKERENFQTLKISSFNKPEEWEGIGKRKVFGKLEKTTVTEAGQQKEINIIVLSDDKGKEIGKIIVDGFTDYALYYIKKLVLFDKFWFYISIKDTIDKKVRTKTHELFHADVLFAGLF